MFKLELKYKKFKLEQEEGGSMFDEQWQFAVEVEREYAQYRKKVMMRYHLSAAEVDILLFLANNSQFDLATDIVRVRKMQKSHVSLAVNGLCEKGYLRKEGDMADRKKVHLKLEPAAAECVCYGTEHTEVYSGYAPDDSPDWRCISTIKGAGSLKQECIRRDEYCGRYTV